MDRCTSLNYKVYNTTRSLFIVVCGVSSHQLRDAQRRGLSLWPFGNDTVPLSLEIFVGYLILVPVFAITFSLVCCQEFKVIKENPKILAV